MTWFSQIDGVLVSSRQLLRFLPVAAAQITVRSDPDWRRRYVHLAMPRERAIAQIAMARRLAVRLYWMWRNGCDHLTAR